MADHQRIITSRRALFAAGGAGAAGLLAACSGPGGASGPAPTPPAPTAGQVLAKVSEVPQGSGLYLESEGIILTRAEPGQVTGLSAVCPHEGCLVSLIREGTLTCPCHGSTFDLAGEVIRGPAEQALTGVDVVVEGDEVRAGPGPS